MRVCLRLRERLAISRRLPHRQRLARHLGIPLRSGLVFAKTRRAYQSKLVTAPRAPEKLNLEYSSPESKLNMRRRRIFPLSIFGV